MADHLPSVPVGTAADVRGLPRTVLVDGGQVVVPAGRYTLAGLERLIGVLIDAQRQLLAREAAQASAPVHVPSGGERVESAVHRLLGLPEGF